MKKIKFYLRKVSDLAGVWYWLWLPAFLYVAALVFKFIVPTPGTDQWKLSFDQSFLGVIGIAVSLLVYKLGTSMHRARLDTRLTKVNVGLKFELLNLSTINYAKNLTYYIFTECPLDVISQFKDVKDETTNNMDEAFLVEHNGGRCYRGEEIFIPSNDGITFIIPIQAPSLKKFKFFIDIKAENARRHQETYIVNCDADGNVAVVLTEREYIKTLKK